MHIKEMAAQRSTGWECRERHNQTVRRGNGRGRAGLGDGMGDREEAGCQHNERCEAHGGRQESCVSTRSCARARETEGVDRNDLIAIPEALDRRGQLSAHSHVQYWQREPYRGLVDSRGSSQLQVFPSERVLGHWLLAGPVRKGFSRSQTLFAPQRSAVSGGWVGGGLAETVRVLNERGRAQRAIEGVKGVGRSRPSLRSVRKKERSLLSLRDDRMTAVNSV